MNDCDHQAIECLARAREHLGATIADLAAATTHICTSPNVGAIHAELLIEGQRKAHELMRCVEQSRKFVEHESERVKSNA